MNISGVAKVDYKTKNLIHRITSNDIAIIHHEDLDYPCAYSLIQKKVKAIINTSRFFTGKYPNIGVPLLLESSIPVFENMDGSTFTYIKENDFITIQGNKLIKNNLAFSLVPFTKQSYNQYIENAEKNMEKQLNPFIDNTLSYLQKEKRLLLSKPILPKLNVNIRGKTVLIVIRGPSYMDDLFTLAPYIKKNRPILIGVDGGADGFLSIGYQPDIILGDMDSVSDNTLLSAKDVIVHAYPSGNAPGEQRVKDLGIDYKIYSSFGTSEDAAILLAHYFNVSLIIAIGTHNNMIDFLEKNRKGMSSTILTRMLVGSKLIDAKGFYKLIDSNKVGE